MFPCRGGGVHVPNSTLVKHDDVFEGFGPRSLGTGWCSPMARAQTRHECRWRFLFSFWKGLLKGKCERIPECWVEVTGSYFCFVWYSLSKWLIGGLDWWFGIRIGVPPSNNPFHFRGSQESEAPGPKPPIHRRRMKPLKKYWDFFLPTSTGFLAGFLNHPR